MRSTTMRLIALLQSDYLTDSDLPTETERRGKVLKPAGGLLGSTSTTLFFSKIPKTVGRKDVEAVSIGIQVVSLWPKAHHTVAVLCV